MVMKDKVNKRITQANEVLQMQENHFKIHLNTQYPRQENALNFTPEALSIVETTDHNCC